MQNDALNNLYRKVNNHIPQKRLFTNNKARSWSYGYDKDSDVIVISKDGTVGDVYEINGLYIALPAVPKTVTKRSKKNQSSTGNNTITQKHLKVYPRYSHGMRCPRISRRLGYPILKQSSSVETVGIGSTITVSLHTSQVVTICTSAMDKD